MGPAGLGLAIWVVGDDRDNPAMRKQMAEAIALRMRCLAAARSLLLHAGDSFTHHRWSLAGRGGELEQIAEDWQPLRSIPGIGYYLAAGNHEGVEGVRLLAARLGPASISADPPEQPYLARNEGGLRIIVVNTEDHRLLLGGRGPQAVWLHQQIGQARQEQSLPVLLMHRPPQRLSCGIHRHDRDLAAWDRVLAQLLDDGPGLLLAAHDHLYARARLSGHWLGVLVGNGGAPLDDERGRDPTRRCSPSLPGFHGFLECQSLAEALYCTEIALPGGIVDSFSILRSLPLAAPFEAR